MTNRIIVAGGRDFDDYDLLEDKINEILEDLEIEHFEIISGGARGADRLGETYANQRDLTWRRFPADWDRFGKGAGFRRNEEMAKYASEEGFNGMLIAFWDGCSRGTSHMINTAKRYGLNTIIVKYKIKILNGKQIIRLID